MLDNSLSIVLLPAPLCPTIPRASPCSTSKLISRKAQISAGGFGRHRSPGQSGTDARSVSLLRKYLLETWVNLRSNILYSEEIGHGSLKVLETYVGKRQT